MRNFIKEDAFSELLCAGVTGMVLEGENMTSSQWLVSEDGKQALSAYAESIGYINEDDEVCLDEDDMNDIEDALDSYADFIEENMDELEDEIDDDEIEEDHMTSVEKAARKRWSKTAAGKKSALKAKKRQAKIDKGQIKVDKTRSRAAKKAAKTRRMPSEDCMNEDEEFEDYEELFQDFVEFMKSHDMDDEDDEEEIEEGHMSAKAKRLAAKYRRSASGKKAIARHKKKASRAGYKVDKKLSRIMKKAAKTRREAVEENALLSIEQSGSFGSLNESESNEIANIIVDGSLKFIEESEARIVEAITEDVDTYIESELIPSLVKQFENYQNEVVRESLNDQIDAYLNTVAEEIVEDLSRNGLLVKSSKSAQLEEFSEKLLGLIKSDLNIIPEQEDMVSRLEKEKGALRKSLDESAHEKAKMKRRVTDLSRDNFKLSHSGYAQLSENAKDKLEDFILEELDGSTMREYEKGVSEFISESISGKSFKREPEVQIPKKSDPSWLL